MERRADSSLPPTNEILAKLVNEILELASEDPVKDDMPVFPEKPIRIAVIGKNFSGKSTLTELISKRYVIKVLKPEALVQNALQAYVQYLV